jgi:1-acyl-sn-glycerol-3-phosphate acyltransferase
MKILVAVVKAVLRAFFGIVNPVKLVNEENIPAEGAFILCANHISFRDPIIMVLRLRRKINFMAKKELFQNRLIAGVLKEVGAFPVDRGRADMTAMRNSFRILKEGGGLGIFPQGTRSAENEPVHMHGGTALIAQRSGATVIPAYVDGPYKLFRRTEIRFGRPVDLEEFGRKTDSETIAQVMDRIEKAIWSLKG